MELLPTSGRLKRKAIKKKKAVEEAGAYHIMVNCLTTDLNGGMTCSSSSFSARIGVVIVTRAHYVNFLVAITSRRVLNGGLSSGSTGFVYSLRNFNENEKVQNIEIRYTHREWSSLIYLKASLPIFKIWL